MKSTHITSVGESDVEQAGDGASFGAIHQLQAVLSSKQRGSDGVFDKLLTSSGPVAFLVFTLLNSLLTSCSMSVSTASSPTGRMSDIELLVSKWALKLFKIKFICQREFNDHLRCGCCTVHPCLFNLPHSSSVRLLKLQLQPLLVAMIGLSHCRVLWGCQGARDRFVYPPLLVRKCPDISSNYFPKNPSTGSVNMLMSLLVEGCGPGWSCLSGAEDVADPRVS